MNRHAFRVLELPAALELVAGHATSDLGAASVRALVPSADPERVAAELERVDAAIAFVVRTDGWAVPRIPDLRGELRRLAKPGSVWDGRTLLEAGRLIRSSAAAREAVARHREDVVPLAYLLDRLLDRTELADRVDAAVDETGDVRDGASPALNRIRRELRSLRSTIVERMERYVASLPESYRVEGASVSIRDGRYVIAVRREGRSQVGGIVHDESSTGGTLFIEPPLALELMNRVRELELAEAREVQRILESLTQTLRPHAPELRDALDALVELDSLYARARYALAHEAEPP
jgi:DNA mismatch repair protein MutS2